MTTTSRRRRRELPLALLTVLGLLIGLLVACSSGTGASAGTQAAATPGMTMPIVTPTASSAAAISAGPTASQVALRSAMRALWEQHMEWTYSAIAAFAASSKGFPATAARLLQNQTDIGDAIKPYYGDAAGAELTRLLKAHITGFVAVLQAAKAGNTKAYNTAAAAVYANAQAIGDFLAKANPQYWPRTEMRQMMKEHIDQTVTYASSQLGGNYSASIKEYGIAEAHMLQMADMLSAGIIGAFPNTFTK